MKKNEIYAVLFALLACVIWAGNFVIARGIHDWMPPITLAFWRWLIAFLVVLPFSYKILRKEWVHVKESWKYLAAMGVLGVGTFNTLVYIAAHYTSSHHISLIAATSPIITLFLVGLFGIERLSVYKILGATFAFFGALLVITHGEISHIFMQDWNKGDLIMILCALIWASWNVGLKFKSPNISSRSFLTVLMGAGCLAILPFYIWELIYIAPTPVSLDAIYSYLYVSVFSSVIAWFAWQFAVDNIGAVKTGLIYYSVPVFSGVMAILWLSEPLFAYHFIGFSSVFAGIFISNLRKLGVVSK